jgi:hypothetical protein
MTGNGQINSWGMPVSRVGWVVLTDGNEYRLYNSHATVPIEEKLFRSVRIGDDPAIAVETLALLSKERMQENEIDVLWKAHFVDRQVKSGVRDLFSPAPDSSVIRLVSKKVPTLSPKEIRASLQRASITFDFPIKPDSEMLKSDRKRSNTTKSTRVKTGRVTRKFFNLGVKSSEVVPTLIREGILKPGLRHRRLCHYGRRMPS